MLVVTEQYHRAGGGKALLGICHALGTDATNQAFSQLRCVCEKGEVGLGGS